MGRLRRGARLRSHARMIHPAFRTRMIHSAFRVLVDVIISCLALYKHYIRSCIAAAVSLAIHIEFIRAANPSRRTLLRIRTAARDPEIAGCLSSDGISAVVGELPNQTQADLVRAGQAWAEAVSGRPAASARQRRPAEGGVVVMTSSTVPGTRCILAIDIEDSTRRTSDGKAELHEALYWILDDSRSHDPLNDCGDSALMLALRLLTGYTANLGGKRGNWKLSDLRATTVRHALDSLGVGATALPLCACPGVSALRSRLRCRPSGELGFPAGPDAVMGTGAPCGRSRAWRSRTRVGPGRSLLCDGKPGISLSVVQRRSALAQGHRAAAAACADGQLEVET